MSRCRYYTNTTAGDSQLWFPMFVAIGHGDAMSYLSQYESIPPSDVQSRKAIPVGWLRTDFRPFFAEMRERRPDLSHAGNHVCRRILLHDAALLPDGQSKIDFGTSPFPESFEVAIGSAPCERATAT